MDGVKRLDNHDGDEIMNETKKFLEKMENVHSFTAVVRGFHYYRKFWKPTERESLTCIYEENNPYDRFAIKTVAKSERTVRHLPKEISRTTKFFSTAAQLWKLY